MTAKIKGSTRKSKDLTSIAEREGTVVDKPENPSDIITDAMIAEAKKLFRRGLHESTVASLLGVHPEIFKDWLVQGAAYGKGKLGELFTQSLKSLGSRELELLMSLDESAFGRAAEYLKDKDGNFVKDKEGQLIKTKTEILPNTNLQKWLLERRFRAHYGLQIEVKTSPLENPTRFIAATNNERDVTQEEAQGSVDELNHIMTELKNAGVV